MPPRQVEEGLRLTQSGEGLAHLVVPERERERKGAGEGQERGGL